MPRTISKLRSPRTSTTFYLFVQLIHNDGTTVNFPASMKCIHTGHCSWSIALFKHVLCCKNIYKLAIAMPFTVTQRINARSEKNYVTNSKIRKIAQNVSTPTEPTQVRTSRWLISVTVGQWHKSGAKQLVKKVRVSKCVCVWNWVCMHARACVRGSVGVRANVRKSWSETKQG